MAFDHILVPLDGSASAERALIHAGRVGRAYGSRVFLLRVLDTSPALLNHCPDSVEWRLRRLEATRYMRAAAEHAALRDLNTEWCVLEGRPAEQIMRFVDTHNVDLVALSAHGEGRAHAFAFGGTAQKIASAPGVSCTVLRDNGRDSEDTSAHYRRILVPLDGSKRAEWALNVAAGMAAEAASEIIVLQVVPPPEMMPRSRPLTAKEATLHHSLAECNRTAAECYLDEVRESHGANRPLKTRLVVSGRIAQTILQVAAEEHADLIILAAHGAADETVCHQTSTCQYLLARSHRPVVVLQDGDGPAMPAVQAHIARAMAGRHAVS